MKDWIVDSMQSWRTVIARGAGVVALGVLPAVVTAQQPGTCENAAARITGRALPTVGSPDWNDWVTLTGCGTRGATIMAGALRAPSVRNENELGRLDHLTGLLDGWFQPSLITAYEAIASSKDAAPALRLRAMWLLAGLLSPTIEVAGPLQGYMTNDCSATTRNVTLREAPSSIPAPAFDAARSAITQAREDVNAPEYVRSTARCWDGVLSGAINVHDDAVEPDPRRTEQTVYTTRPADDVLIEQPVSQQTVVVEEPIRVQYECGNRFVVYNDYYDDVAVRYSMVGGSSVLRVRRGGPYVFVAARVGPLSFWVGERRVAYYETWYRPCGSRVLVVAQPVYPWYGWRFGLGIVSAGWYSRPRYYAAPRYYPAPRHNEPRRTEPRYAEPRRDYPRDERPRTDDRDGRNGNRNNGNGNGRGNGGNNGNGNGRGNGGNGGGNSFYSVPPAGPYPSTPLPQGGGQARPAEARPRGNDRAESKQENGSKGTWNRAAEKAGKRAK